MNAWARIESGTQFPGLPAATRPAMPDADAASKQEVLFLLRGLGAVENYAKGASVFSAGGNANAVYRVVSGAIALWRSLPNGKRHIVDFRLPGEWFGVVHRPMHTINVEATADCVLVAYRRGYVDQICDAVPSFHRTMTRLVAEPVISRNDAALGEMRTAKERIAEFLLKASQRAAAASEIALPLTGRTIGERINESEETVSTCLREFAETGAIVWTSEGALAVTNSAALQSVI